MSEFICAPPVTFFPVFNPIYWLISVKSTRILVLLTLDIFLSRKLICTYVYKAIFQKYVYPIFIP